MAATSRQIDGALLVGRLAAAFVFVNHGYVKLFVMGHAVVTAFFTSLGIPMPGLAAWCIAVLEFGGGLALALGAFTRPLATLFVCDMLGAIILAQYRRGFVGGYELEFLLAMAAFTLAYAGAGAYSVDAWRAARQDS